MPKDLPEGSADEPLGDYSSDSNSNSDSKCNSDTTNDSEPNEPIEKLSYAFGPDNSFAIYGPHFGWRFTSSPATIASFHALDVAKIFTIAFTPYGDWIVTGQDTNGSPVVAYRVEESSTIPISAAQAWTDAHAGYRKIFNLLRRTDGQDVSKLARAAFTAGPDGSWWAHTSTGTHHHALPAPLSSQIASNAHRGVHASHIALGMLDSFVALWSDGSRTYSLTGYADLATHLDSPDGIEFVALNPQSQEHFLVKSDGFVCYALDRDDAHEGLLGQQIRAYMQRRACKDGSVFNYQSTGKPLPLYPSSTLTPPRPRRSGAELRHLALDNLHGLLPRPLSASALPARRPAPPRPETFERVEAGCPRRGGRGRGPREQRPRLSAVEEEAR